MAQFDSPLGKKSISVQPLKEFDIPDESEHPGHSGQFTPSVNRRYGQPMDEAAMREFQERMAAQMDPDAGLTEAEMEFRRAREAKKRGQERLSEGARKRIEMLIGMTRGTRTIDIEGQTYTLQTLKSKEMREALLEASKFDGNIQFPFEYRKQLLARSIVQIAGVDINQFVGSNEIEDKLSFMDELDEALLNRLYDEYTELTKEAKDRYAIKTEADGKEVVEDLKK